MKRIFSGLVLIMMVGILGACGSSDKKEASTSAEGGTSSNEPVEIKLGVGYATEENLWLVKVASDLAPNYGEKYTLDLQQFRANTDRLNAYRANQINGGTLGQGASIMSVAQGVEMKVVANIAKESLGEGFNSTFMGLKEAGYKTAADLKGKTIGIPDFKSPSDMWVRSSVRAAGLDPDNDVKYAVLPIPAMEEAVRSGKIDVGMFPQPFYDMADKVGDLTTVFNSKDGIPVEEDFLNLFLDPTFVEKNSEAVQAFIEDLQFMTKYYLENTEEARQKLLDAEFVLADPEIYLSMKDYHRALDVSFNREGWDYVQNVLLEEKWIEEEIDLDKLVDSSFLTN